MFFQKYIFHYGVVFIFIKSILQNQRDIKAGNVFALYVADSGSLSGTCSSMLVVISYTEPGQSLSTTECGPQIKNKKQVDSLPMSRLPSGTTPDFHILDPDINFQQYTYIINIVLYILFDIHGGQLDCISQKYLHTFIFPKKIKGG